MKVLVTGGCGFIGRWLCRRLQQRGVDVVAYDSLDPQVHKGREPKLAGVTVVRASVLDAESLSRALDGARCVFHFSASVGVGQSQYEPAHYTRTNLLGTATLLEQIVASKRRPKLVLAGSMSSYGEGAYLCEECGAVEPQNRPEEQLRNREWEMRCPTCGREAKPIPTPETKSLRPTSIYAFTKKGQEELCLILGKSYGFPVTVLRFFNVYGPEQSLSNPYTGVVAIFLSRLKNRKPPVIYEDGLQTRDFVSVHDVVQACELAMESSETDFNIFNVGTSRPTSVLSVASTLTELLALDIKPDIRGKYRKGDIRHCYADISRITQLLHYTPRVPLREGFKEVVEWANTTKAFDAFEQAEDELISRGLLS